MNINQLNELHKRLRRYRFFYFEENTSLVSDNVYDMLESQYQRACDNYAIEEKKRITNYVGFDDKIPMSLMRTKQNDGTTKTK